MFPDLGLVMATTTNLDHAEPVDRFALQVAEAFVR